MAFSLKRLLMKLYSKKGKKSYLLCVVCGFVLLFIYGFNYESDVLIEKRFSEHGVSIFQNTPPSHNRRLKKKVVLSKKEFFRLININQHSESNVDSQNGAPSITGAKRNKLHSFQYLTSTDTFYIPPIPNWTLRYLRPINTCLPKVSSMQLPFLARTLIENTFRIGYGIHRYISKTGDVGWEENGIYFRPRKNPKQDSDLDTNNHHEDYEVHIPFEKRLFFEGRNPDPAYKTKKKIIVWHTPANYVSVSDRLDAMPGCPDFPCQVATNAKLYYNRSSAILFPASAIIEDPPERAFPGQIFVLHGHGLPNNATKTWLNSYQQSSWKSTFNWTFSYRMNSDFVSLYGIVRKRPKPVLGKDYKKIVKNKSGLVLWETNKCQTMGLGEQYVAELQKYIKVDIYGECSTMQCSRDFDVFCADEFERKYKFYLSFEDALCTDYVTDKLFRFQSRDVVTVVRGSDEYYRHLPSETFINTNDFPSPKKLAERLLYLSGHDEQYIDILREKDMYVSVFEAYPKIEVTSGSIESIAYQFNAVPMCQLCQRLWNQDNHVKQTADIYEWLNGSRCKLPIDLNFTYNASNEENSPFGAEEAEIRHNLIWQREDVKQKIKIRNDKQKREMFLKEVLRFS